MRHTKRRNYRMLTLAASLAVAASYQAVAQTAFVPNDPYFSPDDSRPGWVQSQTYLKDINIEGAWNKGITGQGVTIAIISDGLETTHPDLAPNYVAADSWDFAGNDSVPDPVGDYDRRGTASAGMAAARGGNGIGVAGAAPYASLAGLRIDDQADFVAATLYHSSGSNKNIDIKVHDYVPGSKVFQNSPAATAALKESVAAGTIHVVGAGNGRVFKNGYYGDSNKYDFLNESGVITVAGLNGSEPSDSSSYGSNVFVAASAGGLTFASPDGGYAYKGGLVTTDRTGSLGYGWWDEPNQMYTETITDYTNDVYGTSSAAAIVGGVLALVKEVQPNLNTRFAKHLIVRTSDGGFDPDKGFGMIHASKLVSAATQYAGVTELITEKTEGLVNESIPDLGTFATAEFTLETTAAPLEDILVTLTLAHEYAGNIEAYLTSPSGTRTRLMAAGFEDYPYLPHDLEWTLLANAFWGEKGAGVWKLELTDITSDNDSGKWLSFGIEAHFGDLVSVPETGTTMLLAVSGIVFLMRRRPPHLDLASQETAESFFSLILPTKKTSNDAC
ncbi:MAG TPA: S8 family serine peptidase [Chthoniobacterales bacterium]